MNVKAKVLNVRMSAYTVLSELLGYFIQRACFYRIGRKERR
jgi:hypothetical protein